MRSSKGTVAANGDEGFNPISSQKISGLSTRRLLVKGRTPACFQNSAPSLNDVRHRGWS
jgi:hypothetical protein